jgi:hypothetical protein
MKRKPYNHMNAKTGLWRNGSAGGFYPQCSRFKSVQAHQNLLGVST